MKKQQYQQYQQISTHTLIIKPHTHTHTLTTRTSAAHMISNNNVIKLLLPQYILIFLISQLIVSQLSKY